MRWLFIAMTVILFAIEGLNFLKHDQPMFEDEDGIILVALLVACCAFVTD